MFKQINLETKEKAFKLTSYYDIVGILPKTSPNKYLKLYEKFKDNKLTNNTTVYLTPLSSIPSYKFKNFIEENKLNISTARKFDKLNTLIINDDFIKENYFFPEKESSKYYIIPNNIIIDNFNKYIKEDKFDNIEYTGYGNNREIFKGNYIISRKDLYDAINFDSKFTQLMTFPHETGYLIKDFHGNKKACDNYEFFMNLTDIITKHNLDIVFDIHINNEANKDTIIDLDTFKTLYSMLSSEDKDNWSIAREIIANSNFEESKPYILFLFNRFDTLRNKSDNKNYHLIHKIIITKYKFSTEYDYDKFITDIVTKYPQYKQIMCDCLAVHLNHLFKTSLIKEIYSL